MSLPGTDPPSLSLPALIAQAVIGTLELMLPQARETSGGQTRAALRRWPDAAATRLVCRHPWQSTAETGGRVGSAGPRVCLPIQRFDRFCRCGRRLRLPPAVC